MKGIGRVVLKSNSLPSHCSIWTAPFSSGAGRGRGAPFPSHRIIGKPPDEKTEDEFSQSPLSAGRGGGATLPSQAIRFAPASGHGRGRGETKDINETSPQTPFRSWQEDPTIGLAAGRGRGITLKRPTVSEMAQSQPTEPAIKPPQVAVGGEDREPAIQPPQAAVGGEDKDGLYERSTESTVKLSLPQQVEQTDELYSRPTQPPVKPIFMKREVEPSKPWEPYGRGVPVQQAFGGPRAPIGEENRHARPERRAIPGVGRQAFRRPATPASTVQRLTGDDAVKQALDILKKRAEETGITEGPGDMRGRGRGRGAMAAGRGRGRGRGRGGRNEELPEGEDEPEDLLAGDDAVGERFVKRIGEDKWKEIEELIEDVSSDVLPPESDEDDYVEALHTNLSLEFEPEYYMEDFGTNPDIDEKPPISLRDYLVQMKPLLVTAEGIENEEEWEAFLEDTMRRAPYLRELLHCYGGYGRLSAREEQAHLKRLANYIPDNAHQSVKNFTERALLSLQSNPGWGFEKKYLFTRKLVEDVAQHYKEKQKR